ncbi:MAG: tetratricopeptide repeat protein [Magnetococcales bacterium]|nr:tetratricopeptide repeat protein [Magnetococcales bacterium]
MEILAFFSFKGGVGRTALMTNLAACWASQGSFVGLVDMDLAAPGLSYSPLLNPVAGDPKEPRPGFSDLLAAYYEGRDPGGEDFGYLSSEVFPELFREMRAPGGEWGKGGRVLVMEAGSVHFRYPPVTSNAEDLAIPPHKGRRPESPDARALRAFATLLRRDLETYRPPGEDGQPGSRGLDYLLIDCRTGFPELLDMVLGYLADRMVLVSGLNEQNLTGLDLTLARLRKERIPRGSYATDLVVVFSPVPVHFYDDLDAQAVFNAAKSIVNAYRLPATDQEQQEVGPAIFTLPYTPRLASSDLPFAYDNPKHPYSQHVIEIATFLDKKTTVQQQEELTRPSKSSGEKPRKGAYPVDEEALIPALPTDRDEKDYRALLQLPRWYWPLDQEMRQTPAVKQRRQELLPQRHDRTTEDDDLFLDALCGSVMDGEEKQRLLDSFGTLSPSQIQEQLENLLKHRQRLAILAMTLQDELRKLLYERQKNWAERIVGPGEGVRRFLLWPLEGIHLFPTWEPLPDYWFSLARDIKADLGLKQRAWEAVERALALVPSRERSLESLLELIDPLDAAWNKQLWPRARALAGEDPWLQFECLRHESKPTDERIAAILEPLLGQEPPEDGHRCFRLAAWILDHHPSLASRTEPFLRRAMARLPDKAVVFLAWGHLLFRHLAQPEEAEAAYRKAIALDEKISYPWNNLGILFSQLGRHEEAEAAYRKTIALDDKNPAPWNGLGILFRQLGRHEEAEAAYRKAIALDEKDETPWNNLGMNSFSVFGRCQTALNQLAEGLQRKATEPYLRMNQARLLMLMGRSEEGRAALNQARAGFANPETIDALENLILLDVELHQDPLPLPPEAGNLLASWQKHRPDDINVLHIEGVLALSRGEAWPVERVHSHLPYFESCYDTLWLLYCIGGLRPDLRSAARDGARALLAAYPAMQSRLKGVPLSDERIARFHPFAAGLSDGLGDPGDRPLFCSDLADCGQIDAECTDAEF